MNSITSSMFHCSHCDAQYSKWSGRCTQCSKWGTIANEGGGTKASAANKTAAAPAAVVGFESIKSSAAKRTPTNITEFDRVLAGGIVPGQAILIAGEPGIGKSTLLTQLAGSMKGVMYVAGEESPSQLKLRFDRLKLDASDLKIVTSTKVEPIVSAIKKHKPSLVIVDSIQTVTTQEHEAVAGAPTHLRAATAQLVATAKETNTPVILVGQITKDGQVAGPKMLEHMVDTVLSLEGDPQHAYRLLRTTKHRFGAADEIGVFEMTSGGLQGVDSPSGLFLTDSNNSPGTAITCTIEGSRAFLVEIQALVNTSSYGTPVRRGSGFNTNRMQMLLAILEKHGGISFAGQDVYVNVVGGMQVKEPAADLAVCAALASSRFNKAISQSVIIGEVGLSGEVRPVSQRDRRAKEAKRLGLNAVIDSTQTKTISDLVKRIK